MTDGNHSPPLPENASRRRSSFTGAFTDLFSRSPTNTTTNGNRSQGQGPSAYSGPIATAAAQANQRRLSLSTVGLSATSPNQTSPFNNIKGGRRESVSSSNSGSVDESPFEDEAPTPSAGGNPATGNLGRRLSFGARAMRDMRASTGNVGNANGRAPTENNNSAAPTAKGRGEGFNFEKSIRSRAERGSVSAAPGGPPTSGPHGRAKSVAIMEPPKEMPKAKKTPDAFQERILKGDFYMD